MNANGTGHALVEPGEGEIIEARGNRIVIKVASASQLICEYTAPGNFPGPPLHVHPGFDETFILLDGRLNVAVREQVAELTPGTTAYVSGDVPHTFSNPDGEPARFLLVCSPGGFEDYFRGIASGDEEAIAAVAQRFGYKALESVG